MKYVLKYIIGIHIRSGDIFQNKGHRLYKQPNTKICPALLSLYLYPIKKTSNDKRYPFIYVGFYINIM